VGFDPDYDAAGIEGGVRTNLIASSPNNTMSSQPDQTMAHRLPEGPDVAGVLGAGCKGYPHRLFKPPIARPNRVAAMSNTRIPMKHGLSIWQLLSTDTHVRLCHGDC